MSASHVGKWWHRDPNSQRIVCDLCPRQCTMKEGDRGFCFVRKIEGNQLVLDTYGKSTGFCIDPIEKKPLHHFYPGTSVLSFGTAGCNLGCQFCQNWDISKSREVAKLSAVAEPDLIAHAAKELGCKSVAFTYNDPVIWAEYAIDTAKACRAVGLQSVAVTAGYISPEARRDFYVHMDAANVDLKAFTEDFYRKITYSHLEPVLDTLRYLKHETDVWFEITNLVIPDANDSDDELTRMCDWILDALGPDVPIHFSAFHPDFRMTDRPRTPPDTLLRAYGIAKRAGLHYPYVGNVHDVAHGSTYCHACSSQLVERDWYQLGRYGLVGSLCKVCGATLSGRFADAPGDWGRKRQPVNLDSFRQSNLPRKDDRVSLPIVRLTAPNQRLSNPPVEEAMATIPISAPTKLDMLKLDELSGEQKDAIQHATQLVVIAAVCNRKLTDTWLTLLGSMANQNVMGMFTTLKRGGQLRGCCGFVGRPMPLSEAILMSAIRTAKEDVRMPCVSTSELPYLSLDVSLLASPIVVTVQPESRPEQVQVGKHGLRISRGQQLGVLLPSVPLEQKWDSVEFLQGVCRKAGLPETAWMDSDTLLETFDGLFIEGRIEASRLPAELPNRKAPGDIHSLLRLKEVATQNLIALSQNATPTYYALDAMEGSVNGIVLTLVDTTSKRALAHWIQTSVRNTIPLQASLFELCQAAAGVLSKARFQKATDIELAITILYDPAHHGTIQFDDWEGDQLQSELGHCETAGLDPAFRALVASCGDRAAVAFDAEKSVEVLLSEAASEIKTRRNPIGVFSMGCMSTATSLLASNATLPLADDEVRPPAVAQAFYPAEPEARRKCVAEFKAKVPSEVRAKPALAIMTPHAGLRFSGQVAMDVWSQVQLPSSVLIIGPKHTQYGCDWAVSPSQAWELPGGERWQTDMVLMHKIASGVEGMELDLAAHAREHSVELQLPILEALTSADARPKIVAVAVKSASLEEIIRSAEQLADVLRELPERPLLVISSDMNHFANEAENRRRDRLAIDAMLTGNPLKLIEVCAENSISMCGLVSAAIVMQTLIELGEEFVVEEISYDTSASSSGNSDRVVGYAGVVFRGK